MAGKGFSLDDYKDVAERITEFYERFPEGSLTRLGDPVITEVGGKVFVIYSALAYRSPDDPQPATGTAWEPFPGSTPYTRDSELMNAETAAWGRAIIAAGISSKKIASRQEVRNRQAPVQTQPPRVVKEAIPSDLATTLIDGVKESGATRGDVRMWLISAGVQDVPKQGDLESVIRGLSSQEAEAFGQSISQHTAKGQVAA